METRGLPPGSPSPFPSSHPLAPTVIQSNRDQIEGANPCRLSCCHRPPKAPATEECKCKIKHSADFKTNKSTLFARNQRNSQRFQNTQVIEVFFSWVSSWKYYIAYFWTPGRLHFFQNNISKLLYSNESIAILCVVSKWLVLFGFIICLRRLGVVIK